MSPTRSTERCASWTCILLLWSCAGPPADIPADPIAALDLAESLLDRDEAETANGVLGWLDEETYLDDDRARFDALRVRALYGLGDYYEAFRIARSFVEEHRFSALAGTVEEVEFRCGKQLLEDDDSDGALVLAHFVSRFDASRHAAEALKLLGDYAFEEQDYLVADRRFSRLLQVHPSSEWAEYARYRLALTTFRRVRGPEYDFEQMTLARNELRAYLALHPERPEFRREAEDALSVLQAWAAERHVIIADFYRTIGNQAGETLHLEIARRDFPNTNAGRLAADRLAQGGNEDGT